MKEGGPLHDLIYSRTVTVAFPIKLTPHLHIEDNFARAGSSWTLKTLRNGGLATAAISRAVKTIW